MLDNETYELVQLALRTLFLVGLPLIALLSLAGLIAAFFQAATTLHDNTMLFSIRILAFLAILYFLSPIAFRLVVDLATRSWGPV